jgi:hypothetical protein
MVLFNGLFTFTDPKPFPSEQACKEEGRRLMQWYRVDHVDAVYECEAVAVKGDEL